MHAIFGASIAWGALGRLEAKLSKADKTRKCLAAGARLSCASKSICDHVLSWTAFPEECAAFTSCSRLVRLASAWQQLSQSLVMGSMKSPRKYCTDWG